MPTNNRILQVLAFTLLAITIDHAQAKNTSIAITNVTVVDVIAGVLRPKMTVVITGNQISQIGPSAAVSIPTVLETIDGRGEFLIPGLWDMHVHLGNATEAALPLLVASGVTGVRDMGSPSFETLRRWNVEALAGLRIGPRTVAADWSRLY